MSQCRFSRRVPLLYESINSFFLLGICSTVSEEGPDKPPEPPARSRSPFFPRGTVKCMLSYNMTRHILPQLRMLNRQSVVVYKEI